MALPIEQQGLYQDGNSIFENVFIQGTLNVATANEKLVVRSDGITIDTITTNSDGTTNISGDVGIGTDDPNALLDIGGNTDGNIQAIMTRGNDAAFQLQFRNETSSNNANTTAGMFGLFRNAVDIVGMQFLRGTGVGAGSLTVTTGGTEKLRIESSGRVGINSTSPAATLDVQDVTGLNNLVPVLLLGGGGDTNGDLAVNSGEILQTGHFDRGTGTFTERFRFGTQGALGISGNNYGSAGQVLASQGSSASPQWVDAVAAGGIIEQLETQADGNAVTVQSGTYTPANVTAVQNLSTTHETINGSSFNYTPPTGTTRLIYEFWVFMRDTDVGPLLHFQGRVDGTVVSNSRHTWRAATANADYQMWIYSKMILRVGVTENLSAGDVGTWTSAKTIDFTAREYSSTYEGRFHRTNHWDGTTGDITVKPRIRITAIA